MQYHSKILYLFTDSTLTTITSDNESALKTAIKTLNKSFGIIYINTAVINISSTSTLKLTGTTSGGIIGKIQSKRGYPHINLKKLEMKELLAEVSPSIEAIYI